MTTKPSKIPKVLSVVALTISLTIAAGAAGPTQWTVASGGNGHFYQAFADTNGITWQAASNAAAGMGGYLATITNAAENNFVYSLVSGNNSFWLLDSAGNGVGPWLGGYLDTVEMGNPVWRWVTDEPFDYVNWSPGEPNDYLGAENRLEFFGAGTLKGNAWNDYPDDATLSGGRSRPKGYVVEWSAAPPATANIRICGVEICWNSFSNATYRVDYQSSLNTNVWAVLYQCVASTGTQTCVFDPAQFSQPSRFYRIVSTNCIPGP
jgi:hypothetical protein